mgnify:CR=1 FL=1
MITPEDQSVLFFDKILSAALNAKCISIATKDRSQPLNAWIVLMIVISNVLLFQGQRQGFIAGVLLYLKDGILRKIKNWE